MHHKLLTLHGFVQATCNHQLFLGLMLYGSTIDLVFYGNYTDVFNSSVELQPWS